MGFKGSKGRTGEAANEELVGLGEAQREGGLRVLAQTHLQHKSQGLKIRQGPKKRYAVATSAGS